MNAKSKDADLEPVSGWDIAAIVAELRDIRNGFLNDGGRLMRPSKLPSRKALASVMESFTAVLFPYRLGQVDITDDGIDYFVGHTLDITLHALAEQIERELIYLAADDAARRDARLRALHITREVGRALPRIRALLETDIQAAFAGDPAARSIDEVLACYPGVTAAIHHRIAHQLYRFNAPLVGRLVAELAHSATGIDIHPGATIGASFFIDHGTGVVIGETAVIGDRVRLYQAVTLGAKRFPTNADGTLIKGGPRHPIVEDDVVIYAGATILGRVTIGRGSVIGGNVWLTHSVSAGSNITQAQSSSQSETGSLA